MAAYALFGDVYMPSVAVVLPYGQRVKPIADRRAVFFNLLQEFWLLVRWPDDRASWPALPLKIPFRALLGWAGRHREEDSCALSASKILLPGAREQGSVGREGEHVEGGRGQQAPEQVGGDAGGREARFQFIAQSAPGDKYDEPEGAPVEGDPVSLERRADGPEGSREMCSGAGQPRSDVQCPVKPPPLRWRLLVMWPVRAVPSCSLPASP